MRRSFAAALLLLCALPLPGAGRRLRRDDITTPAPLPQRSLLIIGFLGGWEPWDHPQRSVRQLALRLRDSAPPNVFIETADNHSRKTIRNFIRETLDLNRDRRIDPAEAARAHIICYGQSFGAAACIHLARELQRWQIPVRLTVQVDSIGRRDHLIPANVRRAANFFQRDPGPLRGQPSIRPADPERTTILANLQQSYLFRDIDLSSYPPLARRFAISHWKMDNDPFVWSLVESFIRTEIALWQSEPLLNHP